MASSPRSCHSALVLPYRNQTSCAVARPLQSARTAACEQPCTRESFGCDVGSMWVKGRCRGEFLCGSTPWESRRVTCDTFQHLRKGKHTYYVRTGGRDGEGRTNCSCVSATEQSSWSHSSAVNVGIVPLHWCVKRLNRTPTYWDDYRLGDIFQHFSQRYHQQGGVQRKYVGSIADEYMRRTPQGPSGALRDRVLFDVSYPGIRTEQIRALQRMVGCVLHLRTGDVIDNTQYTLAQLLSGSTRFEGGEFVNRGECFRRLVPRLHAHRCDALTIVGNRHLSTNCSKSCDYISAIVHLLHDAAPNITVRLRLGRLPDEDVRFMGLSRVFIKSRGAFSGAVSLMVRRANGTVIAMRKPTLAGRFLPSVSEDYIRC